MSGADLAFFVPALVAFSSALAAAVVADPRRATAALLAAAAAEAALACSLGAWDVAAVEALVVGAGAALWRRGATASAAGAPGARESATGARPRRGWSALLVVAFVALAARAVLMVRWPDAASGAGRMPWLLPVGPAHHLLAQVLVFGAGWFAAITRREVLGIAIGMATMLAAAVTAIVAAGSFTGSATQASRLAIVVVATSAAAATMLVPDAGRFPRPLATDCPVPSGDDHGNDVTIEVRTGMTAALAGCALALLFGAG